MSMPPGYTFDTAPCRICGKVIAISGAAQYNHRQKHIRAGELLPTWEDKATPPAPRGPA